MGKDQELIEAARNGDFAVVEKILNHKAKSRGPFASVSKDSTPSKKSKNYDLQASLLRLRMALCEAKFQEKTKARLDVFCEDAGLTLGLLLFCSLIRGPGVNAQDSQGYSALHYAAVHRHREIVKLLLSHEAVTNVVDLKGLSPLHLAAWSGDEEIVRLILTHGPSVPNVNLKNKASETALHLASQHGHVEVVKLLLQHGADPGITNLRKETSLDLAAQYGRLETVQQLLQSHPELLAPYASSIPNRTLFQHTPLHLASKNGHRKTVESLVQAGFNVNTRTPEGTALHEAALCGKVDVVKTLLDAGVDVCVTDSQRRTAVDRLQEVGLRTPVATEIAELIRGALKKTHMQSGKSSSPLYSPHESIPISHDGKIPLNSLFDNFSPSGEEVMNIRHSSYSPHQSPKTSYFIRGKTRRSMDAFVSKGPDSDKPNNAPPKKPPRRNLSASPTHPGISDFTAVESPDVVPANPMGRNKSLDESLYGERWRKSVPTCYETTQFEGSMEPSSLEHPKSNSRGDITFFNGLVMDELKSRSKSQHQGLDGSSNFVSVAHIKLRDAKSDMNVAPSNVQSASEINNYEIRNARVAKPSPGAPAVKKPESNAQPSIQSPPKEEEVNGSGNVGAKKQFPRGPKPAIAPKPLIVPKPKNIKRQGNSCDNVLDETKAISDKGGSSSRKGTPKSTSMSVLSPVDVDKEWETIIDTLSMQMGELDTLQRSKLRQKSQTRVGSWLSEIGMGQYEKVLLSNGFDDVEFLGENVLDDNSLLEIGVLNAQHRKTMVEAANKLNVSWPRAMQASGVPVSVNEWVQELHLPQYLDTFKKNLYTDPERLMRLLNDELTTVLDINLVGHRRRILGGSTRISGLSRSCSSVRLENGSDADEADGGLPFREPRDLVSGVSSVMKTTWRHTPETLIDGSVQYKAVYVGSSSVQEFSTTELIQGAIQNIRSQQHPKHEGMRRGKPVTTFLNIRVTLIVSATVVSWYDAQTKNLVREHDIGSIQCTCQASDDLRHIAMVTKASDPRERHHSCHVFCLDSVETATEAILTLGQAFEVAYQLAVNRNQNKDHKGHTRSKSANQLSTNAAQVMSSQQLCAKTLEGKFQSHVAPTNHYRSQSVTDIQPPVVVASKSTSNSPRIHSHHKDYRFPRAESFSFSSHSNLSRAPIVSKEEL